MTIRIISIIPGLLAALLVAVAMISGTHAQTEQRIAAIVNEDIVSNQDLVERISLTLIFSGLEDSNQTRLQVAPQVLQRMIDERLQLQEARRLGIDVSENELIAALNDIAAPNQMGAQELLTALAGEGISANTLRNQAKAELAWVKIVRQLLRPRVIVSDAQLDMAMDSAGGIGPDEFLLSEIVLPLYAPEDESEVLANATELRDAIREGADFASMAQQFSVAASANDGGDLGWLTLERLSPVLQPSIAGLGKGQLSDPIRSPAGVHLFLLRDKRRPETGSADPDARRLAQLFIPKTDNSNENAQILRDTEILRRQLNSCSDIIAAASQLGLPASGDLGWVVPEDMPTELQNAVIATEVGDISEPVISTNGVHLIGVCQAGGAGDDEAARMEMRRNLERAQIERLATRYLRDLRKDGFIDVRVRF